MPPVTPMLACMPAHSLPDPSGSGQLHDTSLGDACLFLQERFHTFGLQEVACRMQQVSKAK